VSRRQANVLRKLVASAQLPAEAFPLPAPATAPKLMRSLTQPPKGHRADRTRAARCVCLCACAHTRALSRSHAGHPGMRRSIRPWLAWTRRWPNTKKCVPTSPFAVHALTLLTNAHVGTRCF
jgi:hypothetical protein